MDKLVFITSCFYEPNVTAVIKKLSERNVPWFRFNTETFPLIARIDLHCSSQDEIYATLSDGDKTVDTRQITSSWYRRFGDFLINDGLSGYEEHFVRSECLALVQSVYSHLNCFWVNSRSNELSANVKVYQLQVAKSEGLRIPKTLVTNQPAEVHSFIESNQGLTLFKPIAGAAAGGKPPRFTEEMRQSYSGQFALPPAPPDENLYQRDYAVFAQILTPEHLTKLDRIVACPVTFQEYVEKRLELRITIVGEDIFAAEIHSQEYEETKIDFRHLAINPEAMPTHKIHNLPHEVSSRLLALMKDLGLVFGCIDMILTPEGEYVFLEVNPAGQWGWIEHFTGMPITDTLTDMLVRGAVAA